MCKDPNCQYCIKCECGHKADEHLAGIGQCFLCNCPAHSDESWQKFGKTRITTHWQFNKQ